MKEQIKLRKIIALIVIPVLIAGAIFALRLHDERAGAQKEKAEKETAETEQGKDPADTEQAETDEYDIDYLILVNGDHKIPDDWENSIRLDETVNSVGDTVRIEKTAYEAYLKLKDELEKEDVHIEMDSAYRSVEEQQQIIDEFTEKYGSSYAHTYATEPGYSEHHTGLAIDLYLIVDGVTAYENEDLMKYPEIWAKIHEKLPEYGFILRYPAGGGTGYPYEPWHIRYVGPEAAKEISENGMILEDYVD